MKALGVSTLEIPTSSPPLLTFDEAILTLTGQLTTAVRLNCQSALRLTRCEGGLSTPRSRSTRLTSERGSDRRTFLLGRFLAAWPVWEPLREGVLSHAAVKSQQRSARPRQSPTGPSIASVDSGSDRGISLTKRTTPRHHG